MYKLRKKLTITNITINFITKIIDPIISFIVVNYDDWKNNLKKYSL